MKSDSVKKGMQQAPHRSLFHALGMTFRHSEGMEQGTMRCLLHAFFY